MSITITINDSAKVSPEVLKVLAREVSWTNKEGKQYSAAQMMEGHIRSVLQQLDGYYKPLLEEVMPLDLWQQVFEYELKEREAEEAAQARKSLESKLLKSKEKLVERQKLVAKLKEQVEEAQSLVYGEMDNIEFLETELAKI